MKISGVTGAGAGCFSSCQGEIFKISKVGSIAGCMVVDGKITRNSKIRIIREGVVVFTGELLALNVLKTM